MKKPISILTALFICMIANAGEVTEQQALQKAINFMQGKTLSSSKPKRLHRAPSQNAKCNAYYVFNAEDNGGFVIVSGDDRTEEILGYADSGNFDTSNMPSNVKAWLGYYEQVIRSLGDQQIQTAPRRVERADIAPMVKTAWGQDSPYNNLCPDHSMTGCVATAMAQVINYHQWPISTIVPIPGYTTSSRGITVDEQPVTTFNWSNMNSDEVAKLMLYCGASVEMEYGPWESSASDASIAPALKKYFGYDQQTRWVSRSDYGIDEWESLIYSELEAGRPVVYGGYTIDVGHEFVCDGYRDGLFHINWGWDGIFDAYYSLSILNPGGTGIGGSSYGDGYSSGQSAVIGIQKPTGQTVDNQKTL